jgi:hypothetical protein
LGSIREANNEGDIDDSLLDDEKSLGMITGHLATAEDEHLLSSKDGRAYLDPNKMKNYAQKNSEATTTDNASASDIQLLSPRGPTSPSMYNKKLYGMEMYKAQGGIGGNNFTEKKKITKASLAHIMNYSDSIILRA